jgi:hypothetical protein
MANLTAGRTATKADISPYTECPEDVCVTGAVIFKGGMIGRTTAGLLDRASAANVFKVLGRSLETIATATAGQKCRLESGVFEWDNSSIAPVTAAALDRVCYVEDDHTVALTGTVVAGIVKRILVENGVTQICVLSAAGPTSSNNNPVAATQVYAANDLAIGANPANDMVFDVPTTGAASTITLPATAREGTRLYFAADGTKNAHTITYRDATGPVALTAALTASKRHLAVCQFLVGKWTANAMVSP